VRCKVEICRFGCPEHCDKSTGAPDQLSYTSEIKTSFAAPASGRPAPPGLPVPVSQPLPPQPPQLLPPQLAPQRYPERRTRPDPEAEAVTKRPFFNLGNKPAFANFFQRKKDNILALPVLSPPPAAQRMDVEAQVVALPIPIPGSQTQVDQVVVAAPDPVVQSKSEANRLDQNQEARHGSGAEASGDRVASTGSASTGSASTGPGAHTPGKPISEDKYSERSSRFPHGPRSLNLDDLA